MPLETQMLIRQPQFYDRQPIMVPIRPAPSFILRIHTSVLETATFAQVPDSPRTPDQSVWVDIPVRRHRGGNCVNAVELLQDRIVDTISSTVPANGDIN